MILKNEVFRSQDKITEDSHKSVTVESKLLDLIHSDICELDGNLNRNGKNILSLLLMTALTTLMYIS